MSNSISFRGLALLAPLLAIALFANSAYATSTLLLGNNPNQVYDGQNVGPYSVTLDGTNYYAFCITESLTATWNTSYGGTVETAANTTLSRAQEEAAFLASYALYDGLPGVNNTTNTNLDGAISFAIWEIMTPSSIPTMPASAITAAAPFVSLANSAYTSGVINAAFLSQIKIFVPTNPAIQSFVMAVSDTPMDKAATPEPGTMVMLGAGLLLVGFSRYKRR
jgi:hypothetical protein